ncbi:NUDIX domain-containing protein, partial [Desulfovibrio sp. OttesenSCG-928-G15]|nr:NUDIX domain-containing protein [Desulfovibrio sp. OttesenSCG-928-G15]
MIQDILPHVFHPEFTPRQPEKGDYLLCFDNGKVVLDQSGKRPTFPRIKKTLPAPAKTIYIFSIDDRAFYLTPDAALFSSENYVREDTSVFRTLSPVWLAFAGMTASHLDGWYKNNTYCGACATPFTHSAKTRALECGNCGHVLFPQISPAVIVGIVDKDRLVVTRYAGRDYSKYALVAGFVEVGETFEDAIRREVNEEVGLKVRNIRYFKSQPWGFSRTLLAGFFA